MDILQFLVSYIVHCNILQSPLSSFQISFVGGLESISLSKMAETGRLDNENRYINNKDVVVLTTEVVNYLKNISQTYWFNDG